MEQNLISVIMPVYKTEESHLRKAIESVINQSYRKLEIVLVDDGSPDQCGAICDAYAGTDNRIRVIHKKNGGVSSARNCGLETVTGDYIFFVDSDDTLKGNAIEVLFAIVQKTNADIVICSCNALVITVFGQMMKRMSGFRLLKMALLQHVAGQVEKADGSCTVFPAGLQRMGKN